MILNGLMQPVISEEEGWRPLIGSRNQPVWNPKHSFGRKWGCERAAFAHRLLNSGSHFAMWAATLSHGSGRVFESM